MPAGIGGNQPPSCLPGSLTVSGLIGKPRGSRRVWNYHSARRLLATVIITSVRRQSRAYLRCATWIRIAATRITTYDSSPSSVEVRSSMASLSELRLTIGDVDLGGFDAESDYKLADDFVRTAYVDHALQGRQTLLLGRKGSGKSALFRQLPRLVKESHLDYTVVQLTPDNYAWAALRQYREQGLLPEHAHTNAWKLTLAIEVAGVLVSLERAWLPGAESDIDLLKKFITDNFGQLSLEKNLLSTATKVVKGLPAFNLSAFGFGVGFNKDSPERQPLTPSVIDVLLDHLCNPLGEVPILVGLDRLDDSWDGSSESCTLLIGLLKAVKDINDRFFSVSERPILRIVTFLRSDIYDGLRFDDKDKHRQTESNILWDLDLLEKMLEARLPVGATVREVFEEGLMRGNVAPFSYIVKRTFLRPREILQFVDLCIRNTDKKATYVSKDTIRDAEDTYSAWKLDDLKQELSKTSPLFESLVEALRQEVHRYDSVEELLTLLRSKVPGVLQQLGERPSLELLFDASVIGIRVGGAGSTRFKSDDPDLRLPLSGAVYVHQSLYRGLSIVEARRAGALPDGD